ncbi:MAG: sulfatase-like hydrolase/transferase [Phycisphaeraceae bacterium]|nr:sulfatase-like hydrolase/transferase [Phycisphaeraceae bacterium]
MKHSPWLSAAMVAAGMPGTQHVLGQSAPIGRPNILFIMADDQPTWTFGAMNPVNTHTPNLDRLASEGVLIRNSYATAGLCSPTRASVLTGRYSSEVGVGDLVERSDGLTEGIATWPRVLRDAGYHTALVGKWHLGMKQPKDMPTANGYEHFAGFLDYGRVSRDPTVLIDGKPVTFQGQYTSDVLTDLAIEYVDKFKDGQFAISLHYWAPHPNHALPEGFVLPYDDRTWLPMMEDDFAPWQGNDIQLPNADFPNLDKPRVDRMIREFYASVHSIDRNLGRLMQHLDEMGLAENTIVIYTSDQGFMVGHHGLWSKGPGWWITTDHRDPNNVYTDIFENQPGPVRQNLFEDTIRVPGIVRWPAGLKAGTQTDALFSQIDWFPTILAMTGTQAPDDAVLRGHNFLPIMRGERVAWADTIFAQHQQLRSFQNAKWKLVRDFAEIDRDELYDLQADPDETHNLIDFDDPQVKAEIERLNALLLERMKQIDDPLYDLARQIPVG